MKNTYYFRHDCNARSDERCASLRARHGCAGYGIYWMIVEALHESSDGKLRRDLLDGFSLSNGIDFQELDKVLSTCLAIGLFQEEDGYITSDRVIEQKKHLESVIEKRRDAGRAGGLAKAKSNLANANQMLSKTLPHKTTVNDSKVKTTTVELQKIEAWLRKSGKVKNPKAYLLKITTEFPIEIIERAWKKSQSGNDVHTPGQFYEKCKSLISLPEPK